MIKNAMISLENILFPLKWTNSLSKIEQNNWIYVRSIATTVPRTLILGKYIVFRREIIIFKNCFRLFFYNRTQYILFWWSSMIYIVFKINNYSRRLTHFGSLTVRFVNRVQSIPFNILNSSRFKHQTKVSDVPICGNKWTFLVYYLRMFIVLLIFFY